MGAEHVTTAEGSPQDRLGRVAEAMLNALESHPEASGEERAIVMLMDGNTAMAALGGYDDKPHLSATADLFLHLSAMFKSQGMSLQLMNEEGVTIL